SSRSRLFFTRREFLQQGALATGWVGVALGSRSTKAATQKANPFAYDVTQLAKTDPKLVHFEQVARFTSPHEEPRRIALGPDDRLYIANGNYISVLDRQGVPITDIALGSAPRCLTVSRAAELFVGFQDHVEVFD